MKQRTLSTLFVSLLLLFTAAGYAFSDSTIDFDLLTKGVGLRPFGMGGTYVAVADDVNAVYWNPAGLGMLDRKEFTVMSSEGTPYMYLAYVNPLKNIGTFGISGYYYQHLGNVPENYKEIWDTSIMLSYGKKITDNTSLGLNAKFLKKDLFEENPYDLSISTYPRYSWGADIGIIHKVTDEIHLAGVIQNISAANFISTTTITESKRPWLALPLIYKLGVAGKWFDGVLTLGLDLNLASSGEETFITFGGEYWVLNWLALRTGYNTRAGQDQGIHFGIGIGNENVHIDFVVSLFLGDMISRFGFTGRFGREYMYTLIESNIERHFKRGKKYYYRREFINAYNEFKNILELAPGHKGASDYLARTEVNIDEYDTSKEIAGYFVRGEKYYKKGDLVKAMVEFDGLLIVDTEHKKAKEYLEKIKRKSDELISNQMEKAKTSYERGDYKIAHEHVNKVLSFNPMHDKAGKYETLIKEKLAKVKKAMEKQKEQKEGKWKAISDYYKGLAFFNKGQWVESIRVFKDVIKYNPDHEGSKEYLAKAKKEAASMYYNRGLFFFKKGKYSTAVKQFNRSLKYGHDNKKVIAKIVESRENIKKENKKKAEKYYAEGLGSYTQGDTDGAIKTWKKAIKLDPENEIIQNALKRAQEEVKIEQEPE